MTTDLQTTEISTLGKNRCFKARTTKSPGLSSPGAGDPISNTGPNLTGKDPALGAERETTAFLLVLFNPISKLCSQYLLSSTNPTNLLSKGGNPVRDFCCFLNPNCSFFGVWGSGQHGRGRPHFPYPLFSLHILMDWGCGVELETRLECPKTIKMCRLVQNVKQEIPLVLVLRLLKL